MKTSGNPVECFFRTSRSPELAIYKGKVIIAYPVRSCCNEMKILHFLSKSTFCRLPRTLPMFVACVLFVLSSSMAQERTVPTRRDSWALVWSDEFNDRSLDPTKWKVETGGNGFGNHELEYYTNRPQNVAVRHGMLVIRARKEKFTGTDAVSRSYTSAR